MCNYCNGSTSLYRYKKTSTQGYIKKKWQGWYLVINKIASWHVSYNIQFLINYCPMCGKKLVGEDDVKA